MLHNVFGRMTNPMCINAETVRFEHQSRHYVTWNGFWVVARLTQTALEWKQIGHRPKDIYDYL